LANIFKFILSKIWINIGGGTAPRFIYPSKELVELSYFENSTVDIIWGNPFRRSNHQFPFRVLEELTLVFSVEYPPGFQTTSITAIFDPPTLDIRLYNDTISEIYPNSEDRPMPRTTLTLSLDKPPDPNYPPKDMVLKINVQIIRKYSNIIFAFGPAGVLSSIIGQYWKLNYGSDFGKRNCTFLVKIKPFRDAELRIPKPINIDLNDMISTPLYIRNRGTHIEQFGIRYKEKSFNVYVNVPGPITLAPGEIGNPQIGIISKPLIYDPGTLNTVDIEVFPYDEPEKVLASGTLTIQTKGFSIQGFFSNPFQRAVIHIGFVLFFILIFIYIFYKSYLKNKSKTNQ
jgi:hypothetical protein